MIGHSGDAEDGETILGLADAMTGIETIEKLRQLEASGVTYFGTRSPCSETVPMFAMADPRCGPPHWLRASRAGARCSPRRRRTERPSGR